MTSVFDQRHRYQQIIPATAVILTVFLATVGTAYLMVHNRYTNVIDTGGFLFLYDEIVFLLPYAWESGTGETGNPRMTAANTLIDPERQSRKLIFNKVMPIHGTNSPKAILVSYLESIFDPAVLKSMIYNEPKPFQLPPFLCIQFVGHYQTDDQSTIHQHIVSLITLDGTQYWTVHLMDTIVTSSEYPEAKMRINRKLAFDLLQSARIRM